MTDIQPVFFNPLEEGYAESPWGHFDELRRNEPVHFSLLGQWFLFRYDDVSALLRDPNQSVEDANITHHNEDRLAQFRAGFGERRRAVDVDAWPRRTRPHASASARQQGLHASRNRCSPPRYRGTCRRSTQHNGTSAGTTEIVHDLAFPLPFDVISVMLGMPEADKDQVAAWSSAIVKTLDPIISDEEIFAAAEADEKMSSLLDEVIAWKRANPG